MKVVESCMQAMLSLLTTQKTHLMAIDKMITMVIFTIFSNKNFFLDYYYGF
jgi:hypothetical protein